MKTERISPSNVWECSQRILAEFLQRSRGEVELTCMAQMAAILKPLARPGETLLDAACGTGHFFNSLVNAGVRLEYHGIDKSGKLVAAGRAAMAPRGLPPERLRVLDILDCVERFDHVVCINTLEFLPHYHAYLDRLCRLARRTLAVRTSLAPSETIAYLPDGCLDAPHNDLMLNFNTYNLSEFLAFIAARGFTTRMVPDAFTADGAERVAGGKTLHRKVIVSERCA
jgi:SAM-dependent methyltransferase